MITTGRMWVGLVDQYNTNNWAWWVSELVRLITFRYLTVLYCLGDMSKYVDILARKLYRPDKPSPHKNVHSNPWDICRNHRLAHKFRRSCIGTTSSSPGRTCRRDTAFGTEIFFKKKSLNYIFTISSNLVASS